MEQKKFTIIICVMFSYNIKFYIVIKLKKKKVFFFDKRTKEKNIIKLIIKKSFSYSSNIYETCVEIFFFCFKIMCFVFYILLYLI